MFPNYLLTDIQPPSIQCPRDIEIPTETGQPFASATWQVPNPTDNSNEPVSLGGLRPPQKLDVGNKHITYIATDSAGLTGSCTFIVYVRGRIDFSYSHQIPILNWFIFWSCWFSHFSFNSRNPCHVIRVSISSFNSKKVSDKKLCSFGVDLSLDACL